MEIVKEAPTTPFVNASHIQAANYLVNLKRKCPDGVSYTDHLWGTVIPAVINLWKVSRPTEYRSFIVELDDIRETRKNEYASSKDSSTGIEQRYIVDVPQFVISALRLLYSADEMPMTKEFFHEFAKKFPEFKVATKL